ncbi:MAG: F0F1 ATP synthase subunit A [Clostridia bacterium]|nr:F0F1 ATP synthase subunit A [Clostridia bacterium]
MKKRKTDAPSAAEKDAVTPAADALASDPAACANVTADCAAPAAESAAEGVVSPTSAPISSAPAPDAPAPRRLRDRFIDGLLLVLAALPFVACMVLKVLTTPASEGVEIHGAQVYFTIPMPIQPLRVSEAQVVSLAVVLSVLFLCLYLTRGLSPRGHSRRQIICETVVGAADGLVRDNMGERFAGFAPFIAAVMALSALSSLSSLLGLFPPTSDLNVVGGWAILVFILITVYKCKGGIGHYLKGYLEPFFVMAPLNVISEVATPVSMTFRHVGNVLSGVAISTMIAAALDGLSKLVLGAIPFLRTVPLFRVGLPAVLSLYFDLFSGLLQAFVFAMLSMLYITTGFPEEKYLERQQKKRAKAARRRAKS